MAKKAPQAKLKKKIHVFCAKAMKRYYSTKRLDIVGDDIFQTKSVAK